MEAIDCRGRGAFERTRSHEWGGGTRGSTKVLSLLQSSGAREIVAVQRRQSTQRESTIERRGSTRIDRVRGGILERAELILQGDRRGQASLVFIDKWESPLLRGGFCDGMCGTVLWLWRPSKKAIG